MLISKINSYSAIANNYKTKNVTQPAFKAFPKPKECFNQYSGYDFFHDYGGYRGIITYNEIIALKNMSEKAKEKGLSSNLVFAVTSDSVSNYYFAASQDEMNYGNAEWTDITDMDSI